MNGLSITQKYFLCSLNPKGKLFSLSTQTPVCLVAAGLLDMLNAKEINLDEKHKITTVKEQTDFTYLSSLYHYIKEHKPVGVDRVADDYTISFSGKRINILADAIAQSLAESGHIKIETAGTFGKSPRYIPIDNCVDTIVSNMRHDLLGSDMISESAIALASLLDKSYLLKNYFSKYESQQFKERLKKIRSTESAQMVRQMVESVDIMIAIIAVI